MIPKIIIAPKIEFIPIIFLLFIKNIIPHTAVKIIAPNIFLIPNNIKNISPAHAVITHTVDIAKRNNSLIIETITLLKMFEKYLNETLTREKCIEILTINTGLLTIDNFN